MPPTPTTNQNIVSNSLVIPQCFYCLSIENIEIPYMLICPTITSVYFLDMWHWQYCPSPWYKASSLQET